LLLLFRYTLFTLYWSYDSCQSPLHTHPPRT